MRTRILWCLSMTAGLLLSTCRLSQPPVAAEAVPSVIQATQIVTAEVTRLVRETVIVPETVVVVKTVFVPLVISVAPPLFEWALRITQSLTLPLPRTWHTATRLYDNRILLAGGSNGMDDHYARVEIYDPASGQLVQVAPLHTARHEHSATLLLDNRVLVVGGYNRQQGWLGDAEVYNPVMNTWKVLPPIYSHGVQHTATHLADGRVLVVGGCIASGLCTDRAEIFDPQTNLWKEAAPLESDRASHTAVGLNNGLVLVAGGAGSAGGGDAQLYDPLADAWIPTGPMVRQRTQASMIKLLDGRVLLVGGLTVSGVPMPLADAEIYDPASNQWTAASPLSQPRYAFTLELLPNGQVMALGGAHDYDNPWSAFSFNREIESYDPQADRWYVAGELPQPVTYAAAAFLPDGRLWLSGGGAGHAIATAWAETWLIAPLAPKP